MSNLDPRPEEREAAQHFSRLGLTVSSVPTGKSRTPDLLVDGDGRGYAVEVKARRDSVLWRRTLRRGEIATESRPFGYGWWLADQTRKSVQQFRSFDTEHQRWWVLWVSIQCRASRETMFSQAIGSLFGVRQVVYADPRTGEVVMRDCVYCTRGAYEKYHDIVASVISAGDQLSFCVNELAPDYESFQGSALYRQFTRLHPANSASSLELYRGFFRISDFSINRRDDRSITAYLQKRYGLTNAVIIDMTDHSATQEVRTDGKGASRRT